MTRPEATAELRAMSSLLHKLMEEDFSAKCLLEVIEADVARTQRKRWVYVTTWAAGFIAMTTTTTAITAFHPHLWIHVAMAPVWIAAGVAIGWGGYRHIRLHVQQGNVHAWKKSLTQPTETTACPNTSTPQTPPTSSTPPTPSANPATPPTTSSAPYKPSSTC